MQIKLVYVQTPLILVLFRQNIIWCLRKVHRSGDHGLLPVCVHRLHLGHDGSLASHGW